MSSNTEETDPNFKTRAENAVRKADPWFDRGIDWLKGKWWTPIAVVVICLPFVWVLVKGILYLVGVFG